MKRGGFLTNADRTTLDRLPIEVDAQDLRRCFTVSEHERLEIVDRRRWPGAKLAAGLQLGALRLIGFVPADLTTAPADVVSFVAAQVGAGVEDLAEYSTRERARYDHVDSVERLLGFRRSPKGDLKALGDWLVERAMAHDRPMVLFRLACEHLQAERIVRPGATSVERAFDFHSAAPQDPLLEAVALLRSLNESGARVVPEDAPTRHASAKGQQQMTTDGTRVDRRAWEMSILTSLRRALRGANVWVDHSRQYQDSLNYLLGNDEWKKLRPETAAATGVSLDPHRHLDELTSDLDEQLDDLNVELEDASIVRIENDRLVVSPLDAQESDPELDALKDDIDGLLPEVELVDVLTEVNNWCGYLDQLTHTDNATHRTKDHQARLLANIAAYGCNIGLEQMARSTEFTTDKLAWTNNWHLRTETVRAANDAIVNHQISQPIAQIWGTGTLTSSDGQRFPVTVKSPRASRNKKYFTGKGLTMYTWTSDRHAQYGTRVISTSVREATYVLDAIFDNETDLEIEEHTTDTAG